MNKKLLLTAIFILIIVPVLFTVISSTKVAATSSASQSSDADALKFINKSNMEIKGLFISQTGKDKWSENLLGELPLKKRGVRLLDIDRISILGLCDMKIVYSDDKEKIWKRLPLLEIFTIKHNSVGGAEYDRVKLGS